MWCVVWSMWCAVLAVPVIGGEGERISERNFPQNIIFSYFNTPTITKFDIDFKTSSKISMKYQKVMIFVIGISGNDEAIFKVVL